uniref:Major capsid protein n=1 Tax=Dulem virus 100 TaxID=3145577 RepID=A0AAU8B6T0_9VIRU
MIPKADIPRASFHIQKTHKTTFNSGYLIPIWLDEVLPGDSFSLRMTAFARMATPIFPIMDNMSMDTFFFFVPNRLLWSNWKKFMGEQDNPGDSTSYVVPQCSSPAGGYAINSLQDYMGLPTIGQVTAGKAVAHSALWPRAYNLIWNEWFRDQNLQNSVPKNMGDGPDVPTDYVLLRRGKRHDYFTSCLPWPQKGPSVSLPLGTSAPVKGDLATVPLVFTSVDTNNAKGLQLATTGNVTYSGGNVPANAGMVFGPTTGLLADLSQATAATVNQLRQSFQIQKLLERDARGGTRYTEIIRSHFGVESPDARLQRPEYLGGGSTPVAINPIAQTSATGVQGGTTPQGQLAAMGTILSTGNGFHQSFTEHGVIIGLASIRADLTYQQGLRRMWSRKTRYDFYFPAFAMLGEQAVLNKEIYVTGDATDDGVFGYQERWAEYRYNPSIITGLFRSTADGTLDGWHLAQKFTGLPTLNNTFIQDTPPVQRVIAVGDEANGQEFIFDSFFDVRAARPLPKYSVPGLIDHF